ncbi:hypothetical protein ACFSO7_02215 [Bacillus sp. CGMCC 1.16607]|uniref:hypothetical protein n=1 Tax=Bacillus sp. CGMCC 1.16607 TaxID=3351842 RepID=UPI003639DB26
MIILGVFLYFTANELFGIIAAVIGLVLLPGRGKGNRDHDYYDHHSSHYDDHDYDSGDSDSGGGGDD